METIEKSLERYFDHFENAFNLYSELKPIGKFNAIGMGGSAIASLFLESYGIKTINTYYNKALEHLLVNKKNVLVSYSGNTAETLSWLKSDKIKDFIALTSGGKLEEKANRLKKQVIKLPSGLQPRAALPYMLTALSKLYSKRLFEELRKQYKKARKNKEKIEEKARIELKEPILVYSTHLSHPFGYRLKTQLNENAKAQAFFNKIPELLHNEVEGLRNFTSTILFVVENSKINKKIIEAFKKNIKADVKAIFLTNNIVENIYLLDLISLNHGIKKGVDLTNVPLISKIKRDVNG